MTQESEERDTRVVVIPHSNRNMEEKTIMYLGPKFYNI